MFELHPLKIRFVRFLTAFLRAQSLIVSERQAQGYRNILDKVTEFHEELTSGDDPYPQQLAKEDFLKLLKSAILLQAEAHAALDEYEGLLGLVEVSLIQTYGDCATLTCFDRPQLFEDDELGFDEATLSTLRMIADKASNSSSCPYEVLRSIYRKTLAILYQNRSLNPYGRILLVRSLNRLTYG